MTGKLTRRDAVVALGTAIAATAIASTDSPVSALNKVSPPVDELHGEILVVMTTHRPLDTPLVLSGCSFETQGNRLFLSGTNVPYAPGISAWTDGIRQLVAWDFVEEYMVFDSLEQYHSRIGPAGWKAKPELAPKE
ncbi:MAG TPA: hypothetical protein VHY37_06590 [Tepidisphaeraceae bacterium]|nr:hypothetical protein [Tepidisphaeraceae bacterium]